jgi:tetratricopeptide (TPR) repeat protein
MKQDSSHSSDPLLRINAKLRKAETLRQAKALDESQAICADLLKAYPDYVGALQTLGLVQADRREYEAARLNLSRASMLNPRDYKILTALAGVYLKLKASEMAMRTLEQAMRLNPQDANILATLGEIYREEREYELAADAYEKAITLDPTFVFARLGLGWSLIHLGRLNEAAKIFTALVQDGKSGFAPVSGLCQIPQDLVQIDLLKAVEDARSAPSQSHGDFEATFAFAKATALNRLKRHPEAWSEISAINARMFAALGEAIKKEEQSRAKLIDLLNLLNSNPRVSREESPCLSLFVLGPSRSGKTTMEHLAAHLPGLRRGYENPIVENATRRTFQGAGLITRRKLVELPPQLDPFFRQNYLEELKERAGQAGIFTNTHPGRIGDAWRLAAAVPGVRFIFIKRDRFDLALRIYIKNYQSGNAYAYDLAAIFRYIDWYHAMMDGIAKRFPELTRIISYEDMIANPRGALATVAQVCGVAVPDGPLPELGDDRGAAAPYRKVMEDALART